MTDNADLVFRPSKIISGGQTGVDRGALLAAIELGVPHGGWCPRGRRADDGVIPPDFNLRELASAEYPPRTRQNIIESDATLILYRSPMGVGTRLTKRILRELAKPTLSVRIDRTRSKIIREIRSWLHEIQPATLNVAGPRGSVYPSIEQDTRILLLDVWGEDAQPSLPL
ncbi:MAG: putative molybdenum carrier protein [Planctomycetota bacterium]